NWGRGGFVRPGTATLVAHKIGLDRLYDKESGDVTSHVDRSPGSGLFGASRLRLLLRRPRQAHRAGRLLDAAGRLRTADPRLSADLGGQRELVLAVLWRLWRAEPGGV